MNSSRLSETKLRSLVARESSSEPTDLLQTTDFTSCLVGDQAWVLASETANCILGSAMLWASRVEAKSLKIFAGRDASDMARRANYFDFEIRILNLDETLVVPKLVLKVMCDPRDEQFVSLIEGVGAQVVREHGVLSGEVAGLEVCRVVHGEDGDPRLEIGVGEHDRETFKVVHGQVALEESLENVVRQVAIHRVPNLTSHPLNTLCRSRLLRNMVCENPGLIGASFLAPKEPPVRRLNIRTPTPCVASGVLETGSKFVAIFSCGIDPELVPFGADARERIDSKSELVFVSPGQDIFPANERLAKKLVSPARFLGIELWKRIA